MPLFKFENKSPEIDPSVYIAPTATIIGDVKIGKNSSVWFNCVIRGDADKIIIGEDTNIQDLTICHEDEDKPLTIGNRVTIGHRCIIHGCVIEDDCLIGMGAIIMNNAKIGRGSIVAAGAVVLENSKIPPFSLVAGVPAKVKMALSEDALKKIHYPSEIYTARAKDYASSEKFSLVL